MKNSFFSLLLLGLLCGCVTTTGRDTPSSATETKDSPTPAALTAATDASRFDDVPVPAGFNLLQDRSFVFQTEGTRVALLKYAGRAKLPELVNFYKEQMPLYNWELLNIVEYEKSILNFERDKQGCLINIEGNGTKKIITISLSPKSPAISTKSQRK